jgi:hypothetical protein
MLSLTFLPSRMNRRPTTPLERIPIERIPTKLVRLAQPIATHLAWINQVGGLGICNLVGDRSNRLLRQKVWGYVPITVPVVLEA